MDNDESKVSWSFIGEVLKHFIFPYITAGIAPFLPSKYSLRTFMIGILIIAIYWAYQFNKYYKQCDTNRKSINKHTNSIKNHEIRIHDNKNEIDHLKDKLQNEIDERRSSIGSMIFTSMKSTNYSDSTSTKESSQSIPQSKF